MFSTHCQVTYFLYNNVALFMFFPGDEISEFMIKVKHELAQK